MRKDTVVFFLMVYKIQTGKKFFSILHVLGNEGRDMALLRHTQKFKKKKETELAPCQREIGKKVKSKVVQTMPIL